MNTRERIKGLIPYAVVVAMTVVILCGVFYGTDLSRPMVYGHDGISATYLVKTICDTGWYLENPFVGGVYGANWADYPMCDNLSFLIVKFFTLFTDNCFLIFNLFYFFTFVAVSLTAFAVFRTLKVNPVIGGTGALLYSFLAYHQMRLEYGHIWLTPYFMVPLSLMVGLWIAGDAYGSDSLTARRWFRDRRMIASTVILFFSAFTGLYYAFFTCIVICIAGVILFLKKINMRRVLLVLYGLIVVCFGVLVNVYPSLLYWISKGFNTESELVIRGAGGAELYAAKLIQFLMPRAEHRNGALAGVVDWYYNNFPVNNENETATLGLVSVCGFLLLLVLLFQQKHKGKYIEEIKFLNLGIFLTATIGGIGSVFSFLISTPMRCYNRFSVYIAFLSLLFLALEATERVAKISRAAIRRAVCVGACLLVLGIGLWDQTVNFGGEEQAVAAQGFDSDQAFVKGIEEKLPEGSMVFQLPVIKFPSGVSYDLYKGYLHSTHTVWSYGGMQGREEDRWETGLMAYQVEEFLEHICYGGYKGLYIDQELFIEQGYDFAFYYRELSGLLGEPAIVSEDGRLYFWDLTGYAEELSARLGAEEMKRRGKMEYRTEVDRAD